MEVGFGQNLEQLNHTSVILWWGIGIDLGCVPKSGCPYEDKCFKEILVKYLWNNMENIGKYSSISVEKLKKDKMISYPF